VGAINAVKVAGEYLQRGPSHRSTRVYHLFRVATRLSSLYLVFVEDPPIIRLVDVHRFPVIHGHDPAAEKCDDDVGRNRFSSEKAFANSRVQLRLIDEYLQVNGNFHLNLLLAFFKVSKSDS